MSLPMYAEYKDSNVAWLGKVPSHWETRPLKHIVVNPITDGPHETPAFGTEGVPFVSAEAVSSGRIDFGKIRAHISYEDHRKFSLKYKPRLHDIYMVKSGATTGVTAIVETEEEFNIWSPLAAIRCDIAVANPYYVLNFLRSRNFQEAVSLNWSFGTQQNIGMRVLGDLPVALPPVLEQINIAAFLDREIAKIDTLIAEQEKLIDLLVEKRQATISRTVTKGLNPNVEMKASGVAWLGEVPAHWETKALKHLCALLKDGTHLPPPRVDDGIPLLSVRNIDDSRFGLRADDSLISADDYAELCRAFTPQVSDVLMAIVGATLGKVAIVPDGLGLFQIQRSLAIFRTRPTLLPEWLFYCMSSGAFQRLLWEHVGFSAQPGIYLGTLQGFKMPVPDVKEQKRIVEFLNVELSRLETLQAAAGQGVALLRERRTALITGAVTGQIDVRCAARQPAAKKTELIAV